jgi:hypothetical protein
VGPPDISFPTDPNGIADRVQVNVHRTSDAGNPIPTFFARLFGVPWVSISATATAEAAPTNAMTCVKPFMIPDKWIEKSKPTNTLFDLGTDTYVGADKPGYTGYTVANDVGSILMLRAGTGQQINPSFYFSWKMANDIGGNFYRQNIATCNNEIVTWGEPMIQEPGNKEGPTVQGITDLYNKDPYASWDDHCKCVVGSAYESQSPRVFPIPLYDPQYYAVGKANGRPADFKVANFLGFFAEKPQGNTVWGHITTIIANVAPTAGPMPLSSNPVAIRLVK